MESLGETFSFVKLETWESQVGLSALLGLLLLFVLIFLGTGYAMGWMTWNGFGASAKPPTKSTT